jgi:hypothetical protein
MLQIKKKKLKINILSFFVKQSLKNFFFYNNKNFTELFINNFCFLKNELYSRHHQNIINLYQVKIIMKMFIKI